VFRGPGNRRPVLCVRAARGGPATAPGAVLAHQSSSIKARSRRRRAAPPLATSCEVRKPSKSAGTGCQFRRLAAWAMSAKSIASCTDAEHAWRSRWRGRHESLWSPKMDSACPQGAGRDRGSPSASARRRSCTGSGSSEEALRRGGSVVSEPACRAPCTAPARRLRSAFRRPSARAQMFACLRNSTHRPTRPWGRRGESVNCN